MSEQLYKKICEYVDSKAEWMKSTRQDFHKHAEAGWHEVRTCSLIADHLIKLGYEKVLMGRECFKEDERMGLPPQEELDMVYERALQQGAVMPYAEKFRNGYTCVIAVLETGKPGPVIGIRTDIDALGVMESKDPAHRPFAEGFASVNDGEMHACGHDGHGTINMMLADALYQFKDQLCGTVKMIWQPAEEGVRGARSVAHSGILDDVDYMLAVHMGPRKDSEADIKFNYGTCMANTKMDVYLTGKACHAASPENGNNAMLATAAIIQGVYGIPRAGVGDARINVGQVIAGTGRNVVCDRSKIVMEVRGLTQESLTYIEAYARRVIESAAAMHGCTAEIQVMGATPCVAIDTPELVDKLNAMAKKLGYKTVDPKPASLSEDFAYMAERVMSHGGQACMFNCLSDYPAPGHATTFDIQEKDLPTGTKFFAAEILHLMGLLQ